MATRQDGATRAKTRLTAEAGPAAAAEASGPARAKDLESLTEFKFPEPERRVGVLADGRQSNNLSSRLQAEQ